MDENLSSAMERLSLSAKNADPELIATRLAEEENGTFKNAGSRKQARKNTEDLLAELENDFLSPSSQFGPKWLNQLQK
jgi:antiviral helicase SKI2